MGIVIHPQFLVCQQFVITLSIFCPVGLPQILLNILCKFLLFMIMLILTPYNYTGQFTSSWLQVIYNPNLGLSVVGFEFICALRYWQSIHFYSLRLCFCGSTLGDHLLGCDHGPFHIRHHDALT